MQPTLLDGDDNIRLLQMGNAFIFRGSNRYSRSIDLVIRLCLQFEIMPVFIFIGEP